MMPITLTKEELLLLIDALFDHRRTLYAEGNGRRGEDASRLAATLAHWPASVEDGLDRITVVKNCNLEV